MSAFQAGALRELYVALVQGNEVIYRQAMTVHATAEGTAPTLGAVVPTVE
jgi:hypothetical protein